MAPQFTRTNSSSKRKAPPSTPSRTQDHQQQSIAQHFSSGQKNTSEPSVEASKRRRLARVSPELRPPLPVPLVPETMYSFASNSPSSVIDLTNGHSPSPRARRISTSVRNPQPSSPHVGAKKLVVKNIKPRSSTASDHEAYLAKTIESLDTALTAIFHDKPLAVSNEELYKGVENVCKLGRAAELARKLKQKCKEQVTVELKRPLQKTAGGSPEQVLRAVIGSWSQWTRQIKSVRSIFFYLDRSYLLQTQSPSIQEMAINQFKTNIFGDASLKPGIIDGACELLLAERSGDVSGSSLFGQAVTMFHELGVYTDDFEPHMLGLSQTYVAEWSDRQSSEKDLPSFVAAAVSFMDAEMKRCDGYALDASTRRALLVLLEDHLIERRESDLTDRDAVADLLDADKEAEVEQLFSLLERRRMGKNLKAAFEHWINDTGTGIIFDEKGEELMVQRLLALKQKLDRLWRFAFHGNELLGHALRETFEQFINKSKKSNATWGTDNSKPGEMVAKYLDQLLRSGARAIPVQFSSAQKKAVGAEDENEEIEDVDEDTEVNNQLDQVLDLFRFVHGKAVFEAFYKKDLARRLLMDRSASKDAEIAMLERLKSECGASFTQNLEQMFKDIELAKEEMSAYKSRLDAAESRPSVDLNVNILSASAWPSYPDASVVIPTEVSKAIEKFEAVYHMKHTGRKLQWKHGLAHCQLRARFPKGNKELIVSSFQAVVLLLFNSAAADEQLSYERIKAESGLSDVECKRTLQSLACAKLRPLTKHPKGRDVNDSDTFTINTNFSHERARVKINAIQLKETKEENKETHQRVAEDRALETQAAIVRIMKSQKTISHQQLLVETINATKKRGTLQPVDIKKQIDKLIEKEYMEREDDGTYTYLA